MSAMVDSAEPRPVSYRVVEAICREAGAAPAELDPLYDSIDPDALDALFATAPSGPDRIGLRVSFRFAGYRVTVSGDGSVDIADAVGTQR
ncbi:HalOD1 output domain-containing protein [Haloarcula laminariae]|uniref:HalOD1 output domain-containing protein n=1 Tax=Haloarcula laminariae TaxID=2961577 RepID=UPI002405BCA2|nr:HalOD1 output domain-containing protein [Halomicroarcula sp. FL173]